MVLILAVMLMVLAAGFVVVVSAVALGFLLVEGINSYVESRNPPTWKWERK